jgi:hypothetical protein
MNRRASNQSEQTFFPYSPSPLPQSSAYDIEDYILQLLTRPEEVEEERQRDDQVTSIDTTPMKSYYRRLGDKVRSLFSGLFCFRRRRQGAGKETCDVAAAKQDIVEGLRRKERRLCEGEMTQIRTAHLEGCLSAMEAIIEGGWDDRSPPESSLDWRTV